MNNSQTHHFKNYIIHEFAEIDSTNSRALELAQNRQIFANEIIMALKQNKGRGRLNRDWQSPHGNLYFSLVLQPTIDKQNINQTIPQISYIASCALKNALSKIFHRQNIQTEVKNKWPNDVLVDEKKIAGILLESKMVNQNCEFVILGVGINIASNPLDTIFPATNLQNFSAKITPLQMLENFLDCFDEIYSNWQQFGFKNIQNLWNKSAFKINQNIQIRVDKNIIEGLFKGIDEEGLAIIENKNTLQKISYGEVC